MKASLLRSKMPCRKISLRRLAMCCMGYEVEDVQCQSDPPKKVKKTLSSLTILITYTTQQPEARDTCKYQP